jgi:hypothetical protein
MTTPSRSAAIVAEAPSTGSTAFRLSGIAVSGGGLAFGLAIFLTALRPVGPDSVTSSVAALLIVASALLLLGLPGLYVTQADAAGSLGLAGHALLTVGLLLLVLVSAGPILFPGQKVVAPEDAVLFGLALALTGGLLLTGIATWRADVLPRLAASLLLVGTVGFFFAFFIAELLPPAAGQIGTAACGLALGAGFVVAGLGSASSRNLGRVPNAI